MGQGDDKSSGYADQDGNGTQPKVLRRPSMLWQRSGLALCRSHGGEQQQLAGRSYQQVLLPVLVLDLSSQGSVNKCSLSRPAQNL